MRPFACTGLKVQDNKIWILDQTMLPAQEVWLESPTFQAMIEIIRELRVRGAPLIGVAAALQVAKLTEEGASTEQIQAAILGLRESRPTAVNLMNAMDRLLAILESSGGQDLIAECERIAIEDQELCLKMARNGAELIQPGENLLTHCNTGGLATVGVGTALGVIFEAHAQGKKPHVYVDETRPLLQGGRLTVWELEKAKVPHTLICDNMAAFLMQQGKVDRVLVGADRIAINGDFANKVGTYGLAVLCKFHSIPFYVVAPSTTIDLECKHGADIPIEERSAHEVRGVRGSFGSVEWSSPNAQVWNPAFDVTPEALVTAWILDTGVYTREDVRAGALTK